MQNFARGKLYICLACTFVLLVTLLQSRRDISKSSIEIFEFNQVSPLKGEMKQSSNLNEVLSNNAINVEQRRISKENSSSSTFIHSATNIETKKIKENPILENTLVLFSKTQTERTVVDRPSPQIYQHTTKEPKPKKYTETPANGTSSFQKPPDHITLKITDNPKNSNVTINNATKKPDQITTTPRPQNLMDYLNGTHKVADLYEEGFLSSNQELCRHHGEDLKVLILITSAPEHEKSRNAIRLTWGHYALRKDVAIGFVVGYTQRESDQTAINRENEIYGDVIQAKFIDHYNNLTLKTVSMLEWTKLYCSKTRFFLKTDDDVFINIPLLLSFIETKQNESNTIYGLSMINVKPVRNNKSKWFIDPTIYSPKLYPRYVDGPAYLLTGDVIEPVYDKALQSTFFFIEDAFITGFVAESLNITRTGDSHFQKSQVFLKSYCEVTEFIAIHRAQNMFDIYRQTIDTEEIKC